MQPFSKGRAKHLYFQNSPFTQFNKKTESLCFTRFIYHVNGHPFFALEAERRKVKKKKWTAPCWKHCAVSRGPSHASVLGRQEMIWLADPGALLQAVLTSRVRGWPVSSQNSQHGGQYQHCSPPLACVGASRGSDHLLWETASNTSEIASENREIAAEICLQW